MNLFLQNVVESFMRKNAFSGLLGGPVKKNTLYITSLHHTLQGSLIAVVPHFGWDWSPHSFCIGSFAVLEDTRRPSEEREDGFLSQVALDL